ncbi:MAG TPA: diguanylate cyclase [Candidatus Baltobacteraceae bacterium]|nr:diguanylate cyclase [Candidatus Baltobacteraceae bacterium]
MALAFSLLMLAVSLHFPTAVPIASAGTMLRGSGTFVNPATVPPVAERNFTSATWFRLSLDRGRSQGQWGLRYTYKVTRVDVYVPKRGGGTAAISGGFDLASKDRALVPGYLPLPEDALHGKPFYVRTDSVIDPRSITIAPLESVMPTALQRRVIFGLSIGFYVTIGLFFFLMFVGLRNRPLADYAVVMATLFMQLLTSFGVLWQVFPPLTFLQRELIFDTFSMLYIVTLASFTIRFLELSARDPFARTVVLAGCAAAFGTVVVDFVQNAPLAFYVTLISQFTYYAALAFAGVRVLRRVRGAHFFTAAIGVMIAGYAVNMSSGALPFPELTVFAVQAGTIAGSLLLALAVAGQVKKTEAQATRDGLTNVLNRRAFDEALALMSQRALRSKTALGVLLIDIDGFKAYNDRFGHLAGDDCLIGVARACASCVRSVDVFARFGGEEFAAVINTPTIDDLRTVAARMMDAVAPLKVTVSIGGALAAPKDTTDPQQLLKTADERLYSAKLGGRNRAVLA